MAGRIFNIVAEWDYDAGVWMATSPDVPGLVLQSASADEAIHKGRLIIPALIEIGMEPEDTIQISFRHKGQDQQAGSPTPEQMAEFRHLFQEWRDSFPTSDALEAGGTGDLDSLAQEVLRWAATVLQIT